MENSLGSPPITLTQPVETKRVITTETSLQFDGVALSNQTVEIQDGIYEHKIIGASIKLLEENIDIIPLELNFQKDSLLFPKELLNAKQLISDFLRKKEEQEEIILQQWIERSDKTVLTIRPLINHKPIYMSQSDFQLIRRCIGYRELTEFISLSSTPLVFFANEEMSDTIEECGNLFIMDKGTLDDKEIDEQILQPLNDLVSQGLFVIQSSDAFTDDLIDEFCRMWPIKIMKEYKVWKMMEVEEGSNKEGEFDVGMPLDTWIRQAIFDTKLDRFILVHIHTVEPVEKEKDEINKRHAKLLLQFPELRGTEVVLLDEYSYSIRVSCYRALQYWNRDEKNTKVPILEEVDMPELNINIDEKSGITELVAYDGVTERSIGVFDHVFSDKEKIDYREKWKNGDLLTKHAKTYMREVGGLSVHLTNI